MPVLVGGLHVHVEPNLPPEKLQGFLEREEPLPAEGAVEPASGIECSDLGQGQPIDAPRAIRCPIDRRVVDDDRGPVAREVYVELNRLDAERQRFPEGDRRVLRELARKTAVCDGLDHSDPSLVGRLLRKGQ